MGLVIIETDRILTAKKYLDWYNRFLAQKQVGVILLPSGFTATYVPDDVEIKMEDENERSDSES